MAGIGYVYGIVWWKGVGVLGVNAKVRVHVGNCNQCSPDGGGGMQVNETTTNQNGVYVMAVPTRETYDIQVSGGVHHKTSCQVLVNDNEWVRKDFEEPFCTP